MAQPVDPFAKWRLLTTPSEQFKDCTPSGSELRFSFFLKEVLRHPLSFEDFIDFRRSNSFLRENTSKKSHGFDAAAFRTDFASQLENQDIHYSDGDVSRGRLQQPFGNDRGGDGMSRSLQHPDLLCRCGKPVNEDL
ncbi:unnamed protein product [Durusdinium trenchii]|uniref:Uncharacterized protein n=1 Tax=Durusdinium trenchii TaxID=1381693 RepID=A0ABP0MRY3_9DINO